MAPFVEDLFRCPCCQLISSKYFADLKIYDFNYAKTYREYEISELGQDIIRHRASFIVSKIQEGSLLDFGCGTGSLIQYLRTHSDLEVSGWDVNPTFGFNDPMILFEKFDIVTFFDSLEHLQNPKETLEALNAKHLFIVIPSLDDIQIDDILQWRHYKPHEHLHYYSLDSLAALLSISNYEIPDYYYSESLLRRGGGEKNILTVYAKLKEV